MRQGSRPASTFAAEFRQLACDVDWNENGFISQFWCGLCDDVKDLLLTMPQVNTLSEFITQAIACDNRLFERRQEKRFGMGLTPQPATTTPVSPTTSTNNTVLGDDPMHSGATRFKPLTLQEKQRRRQNGLCMYCGEPGHIAQRCPNKRTFKARSIGPVLTPFETPENEDVQS